MSYYYDLNGIHFVCFRSIVSVCRVYKFSVNGNDTNVEAVLSSNKILVILDLLLQHLEVCQVLLWNNFHLLLLR